MKKEIGISVAVISVVALGGIGYYVTTRQNDTSNNTTTQTATTTQDEAKKPMSNTQSEMKHDHDDHEGHDHEGHDHEGHNHADHDDHDKTDKNMTANAMYIDLDTYKADMSKYSSSKVVYFFHASWCSVCIQVDTALKSKTNELPANTTIVKVDFDTAKEMRQKYGVTTQTTFVQVNDKDELVKKWTASSFDGVHDGIQ